MTTEGAVACGAVNDLCFGEGRNSVDNGSTVRQRTYITYRNHPNDSPTIVVQIGAVLDELLSESLPTLVSTQSEKVDGVRKGAVRKAAHSKLL